MRKLFPIVVAIVMILNGLANLFFGILPIFKVAGTSVISTELTVYSQYTDLIQFQKASGMLSIFLGIFLIILGTGLYRRRYYSWLWAIVILVLVVLNSTIPRFAPVPLVISAIFIVVLLTTRKQFYIRENIVVQYETIIAWLSVVFALLYGVIGSYLLRTQYHGIHNMVDAVYYTLVTYSTLGYGDITPITTNAKLFTCSMIVIGISSFIAAITVSIGPAISKRIKGVFAIMTTFSGFKNHVVVCGFNDLTRHAAKKLIEEGYACLFVEENNERALFVKESGFNVVVGRPSMAEGLLKANLNHASAIICGYPDDGHNVLAIIAAKEIKDRRKSKKPFKIIARIESEHNIEKASRVGADSVISPALLGGDLLAKEAAIRV